MNKRKLKTNNLYYYLMYVVPVSRFATSKREARKVLGKERFVQVYYDKAELTSKELGKLKKLI